MRPPCLAAPCSRLGSAGRHAAACGALASAIAAACLAAVPIAAAADPAPRGFRAAELERIAPLVQRDIEAGNLPGCVVAIGRSTGVAYQRAFGRRQLEPAPEEMTVDTVFDLASLTKPVATATSVMLLVERGQLRLHDAASKYLPGFAQNGKHEITLEQLLTHQAGLIADNPLADYQDGPLLAWQRIDALQPVAAPGERFLYTDVGFLVLGRIVEEATGAGLAEFAQANIFQPLGMRDTGYVPAESLRTRAAPAERRDGRWLRGEVHDPRAALLGGVAGHAGLFSTADDLARFCETLLRGGTGARGRLMSPLTLREMTAPREVGGQRRGLGWDMRSKYSSNRGDLFSDRAFGHGGFTGTAAWIDPQLDLYVIFLANRLHPDGQGNVNPLAGRIGAIAAAALAEPRTATAPPHEFPREAPPPSPPERPQQTALPGIDVLAARGFDLLKGRRVGLICNHTSLDSQGRRTIDLLHQSAECQLTALFSPEHGPQGRLDQPDIGDQRDEATGLPIFSLYGASRQPTADQLAEVDTLAFDIQDIGARFYTYVSTMGLAMEAAAKAGKTFVVLDRPNPLGGAVEGPLLDAGRESFVGFHNVPLRHGLTAGEFARMLARERGWSLRLDVAPVARWSRDAYWDATGLEWVNPSPNIRSLNQALLYPGVGLLETTNVSVGRGTDAPFECLGAPWIDGRSLAAELRAANLPGVVCVPIAFTPAASKFAGQRCGGVNFAVTDRQRFRPASLGLHVACALHKLYPAQWDSAAMDRLLLRAEVLDQIRSGRPAAEIVAAFADEEQAFRDRTAGDRLYP